MVQKRWDVSVQRMTRIGRLAVDFGERGKFQANSAMAAGTYGAGAGPTTTVTAAWLRRWAVHSVWRSGRNVVAGLLFSSQLLHWRADPVGHIIIKSWFFLWELMNTDTRDQQQLQMAWHQLGKNGWGPLAAARQSLILCDVRGGLGLWTFSDMESQEHVLRNPMQKPIAVWRAWLLRALACKSTKAAARSRPHVGMAATHFDWAAVPRTLRALNLAPSTAAALRGVIMGDVVVQRQAKHWHAGDDGACPFCRGEEEDERHRWFRCPAWAQARTQAGFPAAATMLEAQLPQAMATWGLPVIPSPLARWSFLREHQSPDTAMATAIQGAKSFAQTGLESFSRIPCCAQLPGLMHGTMAQIGNRPLAWCLGRKRSHAAKQRAYWRLYEP